MEAYRAGREYGLFGLSTAIYKVRSAGESGAICGSSLRGAEGEDPAIYTPERCVTLCVLRQAFGLAIRSRILHWQHDQSVTKQWRAGVCSGRRRRAPLSADAGSAMNSGIHDSQNVVWKSSHGFDGRRRSPARYYEAERKPVANATVTMRPHTKRMRDGLAPQKRKRASCHRKPEGSHFEKR